MAFDCAAAVDSAVRCAFAAGANKNTPANNPAPANTAMLARMLLIAFMIDPSLIWIFREVRDPLADTFPARSPLARLDVCIAGPSFRPEPLVRKGTTPRA